MSLKTNVHADYTANYDPWRGLSEEEKQQREEKLWREVKKLEVQDAFKMIRQQLDWFADRTGELSSFCAFRGRFPQGGITNSILLFYQKPDGMEFRTFEDWQKDGAHIKKGQRGLYLLQRRGYTNKEGQERDGWHVHKIFDITQTTALEVTNPPRRGQWQEMQQVLELAFPADGETRPPSNLTLLQAEQARASKEEVLKRLPEFFHQSLRLELEEAAKAGKELPDQRFFQAFTNLGNEFICARQGLRAQQNLEEARETLKPLEHKDRRLVLELVDRAAGAVHRVLEQQRAPILATPEEPVR